MAQIYQAWQFLTCQSPEILDSTTVSLLEGRCPRLSLTDREHIHEVFRNGMVYPDITDPYLRAQLQNAALTYTRVIPTLRTFLENTKYLKAMTDVMKRILPPKFKGTIRESMFKYYVSPTDLQHEVQASENDFAKESGSKEYGFWAAYRQVFLFAMRHFFGLVNVQPLGLGFQKQKFDSSELWRRFHLCAAKVGFVLPGSKSSKSHPRALAANSVELIAIHELITRLRPPELFAYNEAKLAEFSTHVSSLLGTMSARKIDTLLAVQTCDNVEDWNLEKRCGMPNAETFFADQKHLFLKNIYSLDQPARGCMTSFAVKRDIFQSFFIDFDDGGHMDTIMTPAPPNPVTGPTNPVPQSPMALDSVLSGLMPPTTAPLSSRFMELDSRPNSPAQSAIVLSQPQPLPHPNLRLLGHNPANENESLTIDHHSTELCQIQMKMSPDTFYSSLQPYMRDNPHVIFFDTNSGSAIFIRQYKEGILANLCRNGQWFGFVYPDTLVLKTITVSEVNQYCHAGPCIIFFGLGTFDTHLKSVAAQRIIFPRFSSRENQWKFHD